MDVLCSDKTGTLTLNQLTVGDPVIIDTEAPDVSPENIKLHAALASQTVNADAIDTAMVASLGENAAALDRDYEITHYVPFDPISKKTEATVQDKNTGHEFKVTKGAPQVV